MKKKKLVIATDNFLPRWDGISRFLSEIIPRLAKDYNIIVIAPNFGKTKVKGFKVVKIPVSKRSMGDFKPAKFCYFKIRNIVKDADFVFTQTIGPIGFCTILSAKAFKKPLASFIHSIEWELFPKAVSANIAKKILYPLTKGFVRFLYNKCDLLIAPSANIVDMLKWQKINTKKEVVQLGVDTKKFRKTSSLQVKKKLGFKATDFVIGYHGRLGREKDLKTLMRAFVRLRKEMDNVKLLIVGSGTKEVEKIFRNKKDVLFVGAQDDVVPFINAMDVYVLPSLTETSSLSTLEAMSCEVPVVATSVGFVKDYIQEGENGLHFEKQHPYDLVNKIRILINDSKLREKIGKNARKTILTEFRWDKTAKKIEEVINKIVEKA